MLGRDRARIVVAGQLPPPYGGQNVMIAHILLQLVASDEFLVERLDFRFTPVFRQVRRASVGKVVELFRVLGRLMAIRRRGPVELLIFPVGGPQTVPMVRDLLLLPFILLAARRVVLQFHAAGIADRCQRTRSPTGLMAPLLGVLYRRCFAAIVMTEFNRRDPEYFGLRRIEVMPHRLVDEYVGEIIERSPGRVRFLYVGHLCPEKGTPDLLRAFAPFAARHPEVVLELVGEPLPPLSTEGIRDTLRELHLEGRVTVSGLLFGRAKLEAFGRADLFVFPSVAPYESFGLVMVEAMMWGLPIIATDWRGNREVLGPDFEGICHPVGCLAAALETAFARWRAGAWTGRNRQHFLDRYRLDENAPDYPRLAKKWLASD
jgi:glycosyltransferase involved in cell wall biosynthesis